MTRLGIEPREYRENVIPTTLVCGETELKR
jgi:hypothetical protein